MNILITILICSIRIRPSTQSGLKGTDQAFYDDPNERLPRAVGASTTTKKPTIKRKPTPKPIVKPTVKPIPPTPAPSNPPCSCAPYVSAKPVPSAPITKMFDRIVVFVMEDTDYSTAMNHAYLKNLTQYGSLFTSYFSCKHPSYPNYLNLVAAQDFASTTDSSPSKIYGARTIVDVLDDYRLTWKNYLEPKVEKENDPLSHFYHITSNPTKASKLVSSAQFYTDWIQRTLPAYSLYSSSDLDREPAGGVTSLAKFIQALGGIAGIHAYKGTLVQIVYDESDGKQECDINQVYNLFLGTPVKANCSIKTNSTPYTVLRTIEDNFKIGGIGNVGNFERRVKAITECWAKK